MYFAYLILHIAIMFENFSKKFYLIMRWGFAACAACISSITTDAPVAERHNSGKYLLISLNALKTKRKLQNMILQYQYVIKL